MGLVKAPRYLHSNLTHIGAAFAALAALLATLGFLPRRSPTLNRRTLRDSYLTAGDAFTRLRVLDTRIAMWEQTRRRLDTKARLCGGRDRVPQRPEILPVARPRRRQDPL